MKWKEIARKDFDNINFEKDKDTVYLICDINEQLAKWVASEIMLGIVRAKGDEWELVEPQERSDKE